MALLQVNPGSASSSLQRLEHYGLATRGDASRGPGRPPRYYYALTDEGRQAAEQNKVRLSVDEQTSVLHIEVSRNAGHDLSL